MLTFHSYKPSSCRNLLVWADTLVRPYVGRIARILPYGIFFVFLIFFLFNRFLGSYCHILIFIFLSGSACASLMPGTRPTDYTTCCIGIRGNVNNDFQDEVDFAQPRPVSGNFIANGEKIVLPVRKAAVYHLGENDVTVDVQIGHALRIAGVGDVRQRRRDANCRSHRWKAIFRRIGCTAANIEALLHLAQGEIAIERIPGQRNDPCGSTLFDVLRF